MFVCVCAAHLSQTLHRFLYLCTQRCVSEVSECIEAWPWGNVSLGANYVNLRLSYFVCKQRSGAVRIFQTLPPKAAFSTVMWKFETFPSNTLKQLCSRQKFSRSGRFLPPSRGLLCTVVMCSVIACDVPFRCVKELICSSHLSISALLLKSLERTPH